MISNCLIEAIKAKIKDPKHVTIHTFPAKVNGYGIFPHFWWSVGELGYDFKKTSKSKQVILFKGEVRSYSKDVYIDRLTRLYLKAFEKEFEKKGLNNPLDGMRWQEGRPSGKEANNYYISYYDNENNICTRLVSANDLNRYEIEYWRNGDDDETVNLILNSNFSNEDGLKIN